MTNKIKGQLAEKRKALLKYGEVLENRDWTEDERAAVDALKSEIEGLKARLDDAEKMGEVADEVEHEDEAPAPRKLPLYTEGKAPAVHSRKHRYSVSRAIDIVASGKRLDGLEGELSQEIAHRAGKTTTGFFYPMGGEDYRDLTVSSGAGGIQTLTESSVIEILRAKTVLGKAGATFLPGLAPGKLAIPKQTAGSTATFVADSGAGSEQNPTVGQILFTPKTVTAYADYSRLLTKQASFAVDSFIEKDLISAVTVKLDAVGLNGGGTNEPSGALQVSGTNAIAIGTNGGNVTFDHLVNMETQVYNSNADAESMFYIGTPGLVGKMKTTVKVSGQPVYLVEGLEANGYPMLRSNNPVTSLPLAIHLFKIFFKPFTVQASLHMPPTTC
jgi:HK97 family phage major capsid protein